MGNSGNNQPDLLAATQLEVTEESSSHLKDAAIWARTIAVVLCIICGLVVIAIGYFGTIFLAFGYSGEGYYAGIIIVILVLAGLASLFIANLFRFSSGVSGGIASQDGAKFEKGITGLRNYLVCTGVLTLLFSLIYLVRLIS